MRKNIILIGYMGAGKTTIGKALAEKLRWTFLDTDTRIEEYAGKPVARIFAEDGEESFRQMETEVIGRFAEEEQTVLATGGGLPVRPENRKLLKGSGWVVYLKVSPETVETRLCSDRTRPLLMGADIRKKAEEMLSVREPFYLEAADCVVLCDGKEKEEILAEISQKLLEFFSEG